MLPERVETQLALYQYAHQGHIDPRASLYGEGDCNEQIFILSAGLAKVYLTGDVFSRLAVAGSILGSEVLVADGQTYLGHVETITACQFYSIEARYARSMLSSKPVISQYFGQERDSTLRYCDQRTAALRARRRIEGRVSYLLDDFAMLFPPSSDGILLQGITQIDLATLINSTRESVFAAVKNLSSKGIIKTVRGHGIVILDPNRLKALAYPPTPPKSNLC